MARTSPSAWKPPPGSGFRPLDAGPKSPPVPSRSLRRIMRLPGWLPYERIPLLIGGAGLVIFLLLMFLIVRAGLGSSVAALSTQVNLHVDAAQTAAGEFGELASDMRSAKEAGGLAQLSNEMNDRLQLIRSEQVAASEALASLRKETRNRAYREYLVLVDDAFDEHERGLRLARGVIGEISAAATAASSLERAAQSWEEALAVNDMATARQKMESAREALEEAARRSAVLRSWPGLSQAIERHLLVVALALRIEGDDKKDMDRILEGSERFAAQIELIRLLPQWEKRWDELSPDLEAARTQLSSAQAAARKADSFYEDRWGPVPEQEG